MINNKNFYFTFLMLIFWQFIYAMDEIDFAILKYEMIKIDQGQKKASQARKLQNAIEAGEICDFFAFFSGIHKDLFNQLRNTVEYEINNAIALKLGISLPNERTERVIKLTPELNPEFEKIKNERKNEIENFNFMLTGLELIEKNLKQQQITEHIIQSRLKLMMMGDMEN